MNTSLKTRTGLMPSVSAHLNLLILYCAVVDDNHSASGPGKAVLYWVCSKGGKRYISCVCWTVGRHHVGSDVWQSLQPSW